jgi:hypothetical protein
LAEDGVDRDLARSLAKHLSDEIEQSVATKDHVDTVVTREVQGLLYQFDLAVTCAPADAGRRYVADPILIVEVLSTQLHDRGRSSTTTASCRRSKRFCWSGASSGACSTGAVASR